MANVSQLNDLRSYSRHWLGEFIEQYQTEECLWQPKHPDYSNNTVRNKAYDKLVEKLKEVEPNPDRNMVVRKINSLRSAFRREYRKMHSKQNYETRLWYYDKLSFIADQGLKRAITSIGGASGPDVKVAKRSLTLAFEDDDSLEFEDEQHMEAGSAHSASQTDLQQDPNMTTTITTVSTSNGEVVPVSIVKSEDHKMHHHQQQHVQHEPPPLHHHQQQQQHHHHHHHATAQQLHAQTQPQHTTAVKVLEITSLDSNSQREIQQAVNSLEQQHQIQQQLQQQQQQQANGAATAQLTQLHQQVPTIQIAREHLQPLFGSATAYTTTTTAGGGGGGVGGNGRSEDEFDAIGINVASKLRVMNTHQRIIAEKLISDVLFNGQLDNLSVNSHLSQ